MKIQTLLDAVFTFNPLVIRMMGDVTGHSVDPMLDDVEIIHRAAEMVVFYVPDAPPNVREQAENILATLGWNWA